MQFHNRCEQKTDTHLHFQVVHYNEIVPLIIQVNFDEISIVKQHCFHEINLIVIMAYCFKLIFTFLLFFKFHNPLLAQSFKESNQEFVGLRNSSMAFADVDGDNDQDVLICGRDSSSERRSILYINDGNGNYEETKGTPFVDVEGGEAEFVDVDGDGDQDLFLTGEGDHPSFPGESRPYGKLYFNDGSGNYTEYSGNFAGGEYSSIAIADINGDEYVDVVISTVSFITRETYIYHGDSSGNFENKTPKLFEDYYGSVAIDDVDADGDNDLLISNQRSRYGSYSTLFKNDGTGSFKREGTIGDAVSYGDIEFVDVDGDNDPDLIVTGQGDYAEAPIAELYINNGQGEFERDTNKYFMPADRSALAFSDIDGDNDMDIMISGGNTKWDSDSLYTNLYINNGSGVFNQVKNHPFENLSYGDIAFADVDGDNDQDVIISGTTRGYEKRITKLYLNHGPTVSINKIISEKENSVALYPNPNKSDLLHVEYTPSQSSTWHINIYDVNGSIILQEEHTGNIGLVSQTSIETSALSGGIYHVQIIEGSQLQSVGKFIKQ